MTFDREQVTREAARAEWAVVWPGLPYEEEFDRSFEQGTAATVPVIVRAVTDEIRALHYATTHCGTGVVRGCPACAGDDEPSCDACSYDWPCATIQLCIEIETLAGVQR